MPYGTPRTQNSAPGVGSASYMPTSTGSAGGSQDHGPVMALVGLLVIYIAWAYISQHEKVRDSVRPSNIALNAWNLGVIAFTVVLALTLGKVALGKLAAVGFPGAQHALTLVDAA